MKKEIDYKYYRFLNNVEECLKNLKYFKENKMLYTKNTMVKRFNELNKDYFNKESK